MGMDESKSGGLHRPKWTPESIVAQLSRPEQTAIKCHMETQSLTLLF